MIPSSRLTPSTICTRQFRRALDLESPVTAKENEEEIVGEGGEVGRVWPSSSSVRSKHFCRCVDFLVNVQTFLSNYNPWDRGKREETVTCGSPSEESKPSLPHAAAVVGLGLPVGVQHGRRRSASAPSGNGGDAAVFAEASGARGAGKAGGGRGVEGARPMTERWWGEGEDGGGMASAS